MRAHFHTFYIMTVFALMGCASSISSNFIYETSLRGEKGWPGRAERLDSMQSFLDKPNVMDPEAALRAALPEAEVNVKRWGLKYFGKDWTRYQILLDVDIERGDEKTKCREVSTEGPVGAPTLDEVLANDGAEFAQALEDLIAICVSNTKAEN